MHNITLKELEKITGVPAQTLNRYELGQRIPKVDKAGEIANLLRVDSLWLQGYDVPEKTIPTNADSLVMLPIVGRICCGNGALAYEEIEGYEPTPQEWLNGGEYFYLRAKGNSMMGARIQDGDLLLIRRQPDVENGQIAAVLLEDEAMLKRVYKNNGQIVLQSENPAYPPVFVPPAEGRIIGKLQKIVISL